MFGLWSLSSVGDAKHLLPPRPQQPPRPCAARAPCVGASCPQVIVGASVPRLWCPDGLLCLCADGRAGPGVFSCPGTGQEHRLFSWSHQPSAWSHTSALLGLSAAICRSGDVAASSPSPSLPGCVCLCPLVLLLRNPAKPLLTPHPGDSRPSSLLCWDWFRDAGPPVMHQHGTVDRPGQLPPRH